MSSSAIRKPDFFVVGAPRSGTTSLHQYLSDHPEVYMAPEKELHFFGHDIRVPQAAKMVANREEYDAQFAGATTEKAIGEASPFYLYSKTAAEEIHTFNPDARIVISLRNPVDVMHSLHAERVFYETFVDGQEEIREFADALAAESDRKAGRRLPDGAPREPGRAFYLFYRDLVRFPEQVERYLTVFGRDPVRVIVFDDLVRDVGTVFQGLCAHLQVSTECRPVFATANPRKRARSALLSRFVHRPPQWLLRVGRKVAPRAVRRPIWRLLHTLSTSRARPRPMDPDLRRRLVADCEPEIRELGGLIGRDLSSWLGADA